MQLRLKVNCTVAFNLRIYLFLDCVRFDLLIARNYLIISCESDIIIVKIDLGGFPMSITATELKTNLGKYLLLSATEDVYITKNGKVIAKLTNPFQDRVQLVESLVGIIPDTVTLEEAKAERLDLI